MLEGWTTLGFLAAHTTRARLGLMVGGVHYRYPGPVGQGRHDARRPVRRPGLARHRGRLERGRVALARLPVPAPRRALRDARGDAPDRPRDVGGRARVGGGVPRAEVPCRRGFSNSPQSLSRPRVPIMIGGGGEKKTLRLVARYADATNVFGTPEGVARKYAILADHCADIGRDPDEIERSTLQNVRISTRRRRRHGDARPGRRPPGRVLRRRRPARHREHAPAPGPRRARVVGRDVIPDLQDRRPRAVVTSAARSAFPAPAHARCAAGPAHLDVPAPRG